MTDIATKPGPEVEIDQELLEEAQNHLGGASPNEALNTVLRRFVDSERDRRLQAFDQLQQMHSDGWFDYTRLEAADE